MAAVVDALTAAPTFAEAVIPLAVDKLTAGDGDGVADARALLVAAARAWGGDSVRPSLPRVWAALARDVATSAGGGGPRPDLTPAADVESPSDAAAATATALASIASLGPALADAALTDPAAAALITAARARAPLAPGAAASAGAGAAALAAVAAGGPSVAARVVGSTLPALVDAAADASAPDCARGVALGAAARLVGAARRAVSGGASSNTDSLGGAAPQLMEVAMAVSDADSPSTAAARLAVAGELLAWPRGSGGALHDSTRQRVAATLATTATCSDPDHATAAGDALFVAATGGGGDAVAAAVPALWRGAVAGAPRAAAALAALAAVRGPPATRWRRPSQPAWRVCSRAAALPTRGRRRWRRRNPVRAW